MYILIGIIVALVCATVGLSIMFVVNLLRSMMFGAFDLIKSHKK